MSSTSPGLRRALSLLLLFLSFIFTGCASGAFEGSGGGTVATAGSGEVPAVAIPYSSERALLLMLVDRQLLERLPVDRALATGDPRVLVELARALGRIGDARALPVLEELAFHDTVEVRREALFALGELESPDARRILLARVDEEDREAGALAVEGLGKLGEPVERVVEALGDLPAAERWARLVPFLFRFDEPPTVPIARQALAALDADTHPRLHALAVYGLARNPRPEAVEDLRGLLDDPDPWVRGWAARALTRSGPEGRVGDASDLARLRPLLDDPEAGPVIHALRSGASLVQDGVAAPPEDWRPALRRLIDDPRVPVRQTALEVAGAWLLDPQLGPALVTLAEGPDGWQRAAALVALGEGGHPRAGELAEQAARSADPVVRAAAATAATELVEAELLQRLSHDPVPRVRTAALEGLLELAPPESAAEVASASLLDPDAGVRAFLFGWLREYPVAPLEPLAESVIEALGGTSMEAALAGIQAVAARAEAEPLERGTLIAVLEKMAESERWLIRREAAAALEGLGRQTPPVGTVDTDRGIGTYEMVLQRTAEPRTVDLHTAAGVVTVRLDCPQFPLTCVSFLNLARQGFFDGLTFHRVVPDFVVQGGDPRGDGYGGPGYTIRDEIGRLRYERGVLGMALAGPDTGGSQFFLTLSAQPHLDGAYTAFGEVVGGLEVLDALAPHDEIIRVEVRP